MAETLVYVPRVCADLGWLWLSQAGRRLGLRNSPILWSAGQDCQPTGSPPTVTYLAPETPASLCVEQHAQILPQKHWQQYAVHEGTKGPIAIEVAAVRVMMVEHSLPGRDKLLVIRCRISKSRLDAWRSFCRKMGRAGIKSPR